MLGMSDGSGGNEAKNEGRGRMDSELQNLINSADEFLEQTHEEEDETDATTEAETTGDTSSDERCGNYHMEFRQHKREYYIHKMGYSKVNDELRLGNQQRLNRQ